MLNQKKTQTMLAKPKQTRKKTKSKPTFIFKKCSYVCVHIIVHNCCTQHSTEQF